MLKVMAFNYSVMLTGYNYGITGKMHLRDISSSIGISDSGLY